MFETPTPADFKNSPPLLKTADCAPICFWNDNQYGVLHAGWRGVINGAVENMLEVFSDKKDLNIWVGPLLPEFEIKRDECYQLIRAKFSDRFFKTEAEKIVFQFEDCLQHLLPPATFDSRSTFKNEDLASWRRDKAFPKGQNSTVIGPAYLLPSEGRPGGVHPL